MTHSSFRTIPWLQLAAALALASALSAAPPPESEVSNLEITGAEVRAHVKYLASDELQGRGSGTQGNDLAAEYLAARFRASGVQPAGEGGTYFQSFQVIRGVSLGPGNALTIQSGTSKETLQPANPSAAPPRPAAARTTPPPPAGRAPSEAPAPAVIGDYLPLSYSKNGAAFAPVVFAGYGISQPDLGYDDYKGLNVRGRIVIVLRHTPDNDLQGKFGPFALLTYKTMTAREKGAAGILLVTGPISDQPENLGVFSLESASSDCGIPAAFVKRDVVDRLLAPSGKTLRDLQIMIAHGKTQSFEVPKTRAGLRVNVVREFRPTRNVLGVIPGSDPKLKDECVVVGAHYDHLGLGGSHSLSSSAEPAIHHGADDNASGTAGILELAQYLAAHRDRLKRSVLFMGFSGEEMGLLGSAHWTKKPTIPLDQVAAMINLDMVGRMQNDTCQVIGTGSSPVWPKLLEEANAARKLQLKSGGSGGFGASDQQSFYAKHIPVLFFFTGVHPDYHKPTDTWEKVNAEGEARLLQLVADVITGVARVEPRPQFTRAKEEEQQSPGPGFRVYLGTLPDYAAEVEGVALQGVKEGSPAEKAGLKAGDVIVEFDGKKIRSVQEYTAVLSTAKPNVAVKLVVLRGGQRQTLTVTPLPRN